MGGVAEARAALAVLGFMSFAVGCASDRSLVGRTENGRYESPNGKLSISNAAIAMSDQPGSESHIRDAYFAETDRGFLEVSSDLGLHGLYYSALAPLAISAPTNAAQRRVALGDVLTRFVLANVFDSGTSAAELEYQEFVPDGDAEALLAVVRLPGASGAFELGTNRHFDAHVIALVLIDNGYAVVLRTQSNLADVNTSAASERASGALKELHRIEAGLELKP